MNGLLFQIALLEEQKKESPEEHIDESVETDPILKDGDDVNEKPDINDTPMEENQVRFCCPLCLRFFNN